MKDEIISHVIYINQLHAHGPLVSTQSTSIDDNIIIGTREFPLPRE